MKIPCLALVVEHPTSKITIGAWSILRRPSRNTFVFWVKPETLTFTALENGEPIRVYSEKDYMRFAQSRDKTRDICQGLFFEARVENCFDIGGFRLFVCPITKEHQIDKVYFDYAGKTKAIRILPS
jgi:hypothetical protein